MLRKKSYLTLLALSLILWAAAAWRHAQVHRFSARDAAMLITKHIEHSEQLTTAYFNSHPEILRHAASGALKPDETDALSALPAALFIYNNDTLESWNNASAEPVAPQDVPVVARPLRQGGAVYFPRNYTPLRGNVAVHVVALYPILLAYPFGNDYLVSHYAGAERIPATAQLSDTAPTGAVPVVLRDGSRIGYLSLSAKEAEEHKPDLPTALLLILAVVALMGAIQSAAAALSQHQHFGIAALMITGSAVSLRTILYTRGLPFELSEWPLFSPLLYASSILHRSLGDLLLNAVAVFWIAVFITNHLPRSRMRAPRKWQWLLAPAYGALLCITGYGAVRIIATVALNSNIGFDVAHYYAFDSDTIWGGITVGILTGAGAWLLRMLFRLMQAAVPAPLVRYAGIAVACIIVYATGIPQDEPRLYLLFCLWLLALVLLMDARRLALSRLAFSPRVLFWMIFFCASVTVLLQHYVELHERDTRKSFAERILSRRDNVMEYNFTRINERISLDTALNRYVKKPTPVSRAAFAERLGALYLNKDLNNYNATILLFRDDAQHSPVLNSDTVSFTTLLARKSGGISAGAPGLYYFEGTQDNDHDYLAHILLKNGDAFERTHLFIDLEHKKAASETVLPELLLPSAINQSLQEGTYLYAVYSGGRLVAQSPDYPFPYYIRPSVSNNEYEWRENADLSILRYRPGGGKESLVTRSRDTLKTGFTLFSYLFGLYLLAALLMVFYHYVRTAMHRRKDVTKPVVSFTLRQRIQVSMLGVVMVSFLIIALTTIAFFRERYEESNQRTIQAVLQDAEREVSQYLSERTEAGCSMVETASTFEFRKFIAELAQAQKADVNVYDAQGILAATSQEDIYNRGILNRLMRPQALSILQTSSRPLLIRREEIGRLSYTSSYLPLRVPGGAVSGYLNIPFFSSQKEIDAQVSNILVALINLYAFIFLLSSLLAVFTTRWLTRTLAVIIGQFNRLGLAGNELIEWPYEDEIGVLVREYNKMVRKVEESAARLAQSEREGAWREMARQVAHEIKNPLTPMKLNIQHLQSALRNNHPALTELTKRVADSMLEQIDNLSYIASEFSNFAKLPEARPEEIVLNELLEKVIALYYNEPGIDVRLLLPENPVIVYVDRSQLNRVITNLLQNAVEAIAAVERAGSIEIALQQKDAFALITVQDNGGGIEPEIAQRLFRPYFTTKSSGTGLGLAMTRKMVEQWQGRIWFESEADAGTTFFVELPLIQKE